MVGNSFLKNENSLYQAMKYYSYPGKNVSLKILCREFIREEAESLSRILITTLLLNKLSLPVTFIYTPKELMQSVQPRYLTPEGY